MQQQQIQKPKIFKYQPQAKQRVCHEVMLNRHINGFRDFLFGGAARGGKSYMMRNHIHLECLTNPGLRVLLMRNTFQELSKSHYTEIRSDLPLKFGRFIENKNKYVYHNGSVLFFGYGETMADINQYLSAGFDIICIDEITQIPFEVAYTLRKRLTANVKNFIPYFMSASNPGGIGAKEVKAYFIKKNPDPEKHLAYNPEEVCFVPFTVRDNPILIERDPDVIKRLTQGTEADRQRFLEGNWDYGEDQFFSNWNAQIHVIKKENYLRWDQLRQFSLIGAMDYGRESYVYVVFKNHIGQYFVVDEWEFIHKALGGRKEKAESLKNWLHARGLNNLLIYGDTNLWLPADWDAGAQKMNTSAKEFLEAGIILKKVSKKPADNATGWRVQCNEFIQDLLHYEKSPLKVGENGQLTGDELIKPPKLFVYERCKKLIETLPTLVVDKDYPDDIADDQFDHPFDAVKMALMNVHQSVPTRYEDPLQDIFTKFMKNSKTNTSIASA